MLFQLVCRGSSSSMSHTVLPRDYVKLALQATVIVFATNKTNVVAEMVERGIPLRLAIFITLPFQVVVLDYLLMPLFSMWFHKWLIQPRTKARGVSVTSCRSAFPAVCFRVLFGVAVVVGADEVVGRRPVSVHSQ
jgi:hypothetical protein